MEYGIKHHEFLEYGDFNNHLYGTKLDSIRVIIDDGKTCILDASPQSLKILRNSSEFMPFVVFLAAPGMDEMRHVYDNLRVTNSMMQTGKNISTFERNSSIRYIGNLPLIQSCPGETCMLFLSTVSISQEDAQLIEITI